MEGIPTGSLYMAGGFGIDRILDFSMKEYPGEHSRATVKGLAHLTEDESWGFEGMIGNSPVEIYSSEQERPLYSGIIQTVQSREENGVHIIELQLASGSILLDMEKKSRSYQDVSMTYGQVICQALAPSGLSAVYPAELDAAPIGFPVIQYQETDWEFIKRIGSRFELSAYPEPTMGGAKIYLGIPETGETGQMEENGYTVRLDRRFFEMGGAAAGYSREQFLSYEVESWESYRVGDQFTFQEKELSICGKSCNSSGNQVKFTYVLSNPDWAKTSRISNQKISGMSLLGTVLGCERETVRLCLDIDAGYQAHNSYAWKWAPTTGNVMYMMPQTGTRVSLYFKGEEESSAMAVNCIRNGGGCAGADYRNKTLKTEHGMQLQLNQEDVEIITLKNKVMLDDLNGINISGSGTLHVMAIGNVEIQGEAVTLFGNEGIELYEGKVNADGSVSVKAMITLTADGGEANMDVRGAAKTCYLAWEHGDLSDPSYRYRDAPDRRDYDYNQLATNVIAGVAVSLSLGVVAGVGGLMVAGSTTLGISVAVGGTWYVGMQAVTDVLGGRVSSTDAYLRKALAGGAVGFFSGAAPLAMAGAGLGQTMGIAFAEGALGSAVSQQILEEEIVWTRVIVDGVFSSVMEGALWKVRNPGGVTEGTGKTGYDYLDDQLGDLKDKVEVKGYHSSESVNEWWASKGYENPPYTEKTVVQEITLKEDTTFVRVYDGENSGLYGGWVMKAEDIKGLTPAQIQDKFALPTTPQYVAEVKLNAGDTLRMGEANPIFGSDGGGTQFDLIGQYIGEFNEIGNLTDWSIGQ